MAGMGVTVLADSAPRLDDMDLLVLQHAPVLR